MHLSDELLSAYQDGELTPAEAAATASHLRSCAACTQTAALFGSLDGRLTAIPALVCSAALTLVSAKLDGEVAGEEATIAAAHLAGCDRCREDVLRWSVADQAIASLPAARPSLAVDAAIAKLGPATPNSRPRLGFTWPVPALAVAMAIVLVVSLNLQRPGTPDAFVASVQISVLNPATNTLYILDPDHGTVSALDATTNASLGTITVGGRPTALALNLVSNTILVLDAGAKTVTEINSVTNTITSSTAMQVPGTPTSLQVDPNGKLVVTSVVKPAASAPSAPAGAISLFNSGTKQLETVKAVDVAPTLLVVDPGGKRALLVSKDSTTLVDAATYQSLSTYGGGIAAAFGAGGDLAILSDSSKDGGTVVLTGKGTSISVGGTARAITALPGGAGYAILTDAGIRGRITLINADGAVTGTIDTALGGRDLAFEPTTGQLVVVSPGGVASLVVPSVSLAVSRPTQPTITAPVVVTGPTQPTVSGTTPAASAPPAAQVAPPTPTSPTAIVAPSLGNVPTNGRAVWPGTYLVTLAAKPTVVTSDADRIWFVDASNQVVSLHMKSGEQYTLKQLPADARIARIAVSPNHVYLTDPNAGRLYVLTIGTEQLTTAPLPFLLITNDIVASPDERLWLGTRGLGLVSFDPRSKRLETANAVQDVTAVATDPLGRIWMGVPDRQVLDVFDPLTDKLTELSLPHEGTITALGIDRAGTVWAGTDTGQLFAIRNERLQGSAALGRPIDSLLIDAAGRAWFVTHTATEVLYGLAAGNGITVHAPGTASGPLFDALGRAWQADPAAGGFYVTLSPGAQP